ncbi:MAG TPA: metallophosphoesterase family protein [Thermoanaerobaculia bacterium]|nr:metallophosphoesterase family protein [Thermoanaerobaculia bacterium]
MRVGVVADTHNLLRPRVLERLAGCRLILHAGDVGEPQILERLGRIAPVLAVRGNTDAGALAADLPATRSGVLGDQGLPYYMVHRREDAAPDWRRVSRVIIFGHSHRPELEWQGSCLLLNPGSCGPRRFDLPLTLAILSVAGDRLVPEILAVD